MGLPHHEKIMCCVSKQSVRDSQKVHELLNFSKVKKWHEVRWLVVALHQCHSKYTHKNSVPREAPRYSLQQITVEQGTHFKLDLNMSANPYPSYTWYKKLNQRDYQFLTTVHPEINAGINYFIIQRVELKHKGTYLLQSNNTAGTGSFEFELKVQGIHTCNSSID